MSRKRKLENCNIMNTSHPLQQISFKEPNQAWVIEASAGTGKTWTIERLYIKALLEGSQPQSANLPLTVENILVVTFTNDATNELKERIGDQIELTINLLIYLNQSTTNQSEISSDDSFVDYLYQRKSGDSYDYRKDILILTRALQGFDSAAIYTIHGFCHRILQDYQLECAVDGSFELVAGKKTLFEQLVRNFFRSRVINNPQLSSSIDKVYANLEQMFSSSDIQMDLLERIVAKLPADLLVLTSNGYALKYDFPAGADLEKLTADSLSGEELRLAKVQFLAALADYLLEYYPQLDAVLTSLSYDELIRKVTLALLDSGVLADKLFMEFPVAFIDEFQDTDSQQWAIFSQIYHLNNSRRGNVVVVGDPKQAIYRFRGADVDTYLEARNTINNSIKLDANFRSHPEIMNFINQLFSLENQNTTLEASFLGNGIDYHHVKPAIAKQFLLPSADILNAIAEDKQISSRFYDERVQLVVIPGTTADERKKSLLMALTQEILVLLNADPTLCGKIAILVTKNREAAELVNYMRKFGIKAAELKLGNIYATSTASDLYQILLAIEDINNRQNFFLALSSRIFNLDLRHFNLENDNQFIEIWQRNFFRYRGIWQEKGIISLLYAILSDVMAGHQPDTKLFTPRELANLWQLAELVNHQAAKQPNHSELLFWFKQKIHDAQNNLLDESDGNSEELVRLDNDDEQITITTQHKAKGLEYEILFCPYFKAGIKLDGTYDFNYRRPFFNSSRVNGHEQSALVIDELRGEEIVNQDNKEAHRLNYVALTRAKSRLYIYLKQPTVSKVTGKYNANQRPDKLAELFGFNFRDENDISHPLFNYPAFFGHAPYSALKHPKLMPGVVAYRRDRLIEDDLIKLKLNLSKSFDKPDNFCQVADGLNLIPAYFRQSYSSLTSMKKHGEFPLNDYYVTEEAVPVNQLEYRYSILEDKNLKGAVFGTLFHELCENYPLKPNKLAEIIRLANIGDNQYVDQLAAMLEEAFSYPLSNDIRLKDILENSQHELEFTLLIDNYTNLTTDIADLLDKYFGKDHPFSLSCRTLGVIEKGFLVGFIDLFFEYQGKYWVLDYKTNKLDDYCAPESIFAADNGLIESMAEHHYYLQYLLYLVAIKRYLEQCLQIEDASHLLGGAIYFYVRGIYTTNPGAYDGIYTDSSCQRLIQELDLLLKGSE